VVGDTRYGASASRPQGGIALHHAVLRVEHPDRQRVWTFVAPLPDVWAPVLSDAMRADVERVLDRATMD
jgi:tRNA pseudouridine32 synthase/23S rRNA pseudouridine746 synthase/23S rRNA pseudouridine1911/1915/1917 synthase